MNWRGTMLRVILASLGVAALAGFAAAIFARDDILIRVVMTGLLTAVAAGIVAIASPLLARPKLRDGTLMLYGLVALEYVLFLALIWLSSLGGFAFDDELVGTTGAIAGCSPILIGGTYLQALPSARLAGRVAICVQSIGALAWLTAIWIPVMATTNLKRQWWESGWALLLLALLLALTLLRPPRSRPWRLIGAAAAVIGVALLFATIWDAIDEDEAAVGPIGLAATVAFASPMLLLRLPGWQKWCPRIAIFSAAMIALTADLAAYVDLDEEISLRSAASFAVLGGCATMASVVCLAANRRMQLESAEYGVQLRTTCPRCRRELLLPPGASRCEGCGLGFRIRVDEPRCRNCGYLLYHHTGDRCPECGTPVLLEAEAGRAAPAELPSG